MQLNVFKNHLSLIVDFEKYCDVYQCQRCDKLWYGRKHFLRHTISCDQTVTQSFPGGVFKNQPTIFQKLEDIDVFVPHDQRHYPFYCCYDFESILRQNNLPENGEKLSFTSKHIPLSVGIASNIPNFEDPICFVSEGNETVLVQKMVDYMEKLSDAAYAILQEKYEYVFDALAISPNCRSENLLKEFDAFIQELPILGYNSSKYDLPLVQTILIRELVEKIDFVIKKANTYLCLKTAKLRFLDIRNYISPGFSYRSFLLAYCCTAEKFFFPYRFIRDLKALEHPSVPPYFFWCKYCGGGIFFWWCDFFWWWWDFCFSEVVEFFFRGVGFFGGGGIRVSVRWWNFFFRDWGVGFFWWW